MRPKKPKIDRETRRKKKDDEKFKSALDNVVLKSLAGVAFISLMILLSVLIMEFLR